jgi:hypothetical protein
MTPRKPYILICDDAVRGANPGATSVEVEKVRHDPSQTLDTDM